MPVYTAKTRVRSKPQKTRLVRRLSGNARSITRGAMRHLQMALDYDLRIGLKDPTAPAAMRIFQGDVEAREQAEEVVAYLADQLSRKVKKVRNR